MARYSLEEMVGEAHLADYMHVRDRLIKSWVTLGLLDEARLGRSRGRAAGIPRYWPTAQRDLLLELLRNQENGVRSVATLCNLPVAWWLYRGDSVVPLRQAKRALTTWLDKASHRSWERSTRSAGDLVSMYLPALRGSERADIVNVVAKIAYSSRFDPKAVEQELRDLAPREAPEATEERTAGLLRALAPIEAILHTREHLDDIPDDLYRFARTELNSSAREYVALQPQLAGHPDTGHLATPLTVDQLGNRACAYLAQLLGHLLLAGDKAPFRLPPGIPR